MLEQQASIFDQMRKETLKERIRKEFKTVKDLVKTALRKYPETRSSDTKLYIRCLMILGVKTLDEAYCDDLSIISVHKIRQKVQNKDGLFLPPEKVKKLREERGEAVKDVIYKI